ncbi:hypothetical protein CQW23_12637 [Capsicum baccatum]|uniref:Uncharacterized protein n=1 Tax=Capsicum baccatum TaxID=33114 RepID=A0A2G2WTC7_CAPBA|nr:hypothetical protein CQW23_12637 [Capsicum baccatum]
MSDMKPVLFLQKQSHKKSNPSDESGKEPNLCNDPFKGEVNNDLRAEDPKSSEEESREPSQETSSDTHIGECNYNLEMSSFYSSSRVPGTGDHRALEKLRRILRLLTSLKVLELRGCDLSTSAARGFLELRHTLEKLICHNSTDALKHVFASRIANIKNSPHWNRLSFISCAHNGLVLMDESLQLLPAVETLDLSRNKFSPLRKCTKLKHLDLVFNQLRNIASFSGVNIACSS